MTIWAPEAVHELYVEGFPAVVAIDAKAIICMLKSVDKGKSFCYTKVCLIEVIAETTKYEE